MDNQFEFIVKIYDCQGNYHAIQGPARREIMERISAKGADMIASPPLPLLSRADIDLNTAGFIVIFLTF